MDNVLGGLLDEDGALGGLLAGVGGLLGGLVGGGTGNPPGTPDSGVVTSVQDVVDGLLGGTVAAPVGQLLDALANPTDGLLSTVTGALENLTNVEGGPWVC
ncbi:hypothetical protein ACHFCA_24650 [Delftia tsuruhatensis]